LRCFTTATDVIPIWIICLQWNMKVSGF